MSSSLKTIKANQVALKNYKTLDLGAYWIGKAPKSDLKYQA